MASWSSASCSGPVRRSDGRTRCRRAGGRRPGHDRVSEGDAERRRRPTPAGVDRVHVTVLGHPLRPDVVAALAGRIAALGANIDRIVRLSSYPVTAHRARGLRRRPRRAADRARRRGGRAGRRRGRRAVRPAPPGQAARRHGRRLDPDPGRGHRDARRARRAASTRSPRITESAMRGELDFDASLRARVGAARRAARVRRGATYAQQVVLSPGARTLVRTLKRLGFEVAIVSGGFTQVIDGLVERPRHRPQRGQHPRGRRRTSSPAGSSATIVDRQGKADALERFAALAGVPLSQTVAIGDGANDLDMLARAGLGRRLQRQARRARGRRRHRQRALPRHDPLPAGDHPRGDRGGRRRGRPRDPRSPGLTEAQPRGTTKSSSVAPLGPRPDQGFATLSTARPDVGNFAAARAAADSEPLPARVDDEVLHAGVVTDEQHGPAGRRARRGAPRRGQRRRPRRPDQTASDLRDAAATRDQGGLEGLPGLARPSRVGVDDEVEATDVLREPAPGLRGVAATSLGERSLLVGNSRRPVRLRVPQHDESSGGAFDGRRSSAHHAGNVGACG